MKFWISTLALCLFCCSIKADELLIFAGSAVKPPLEEVVSLFSKKEGIRVYVSYGGSGFVLSQMELSGRGDIYIPASPDFMYKARQKGIVLEGTERIIAYLVPVISVKRGNPLGIHSLKDLVRPGIRIAIGEPSSVCLGIYAMEILEHNHIRDAVQKNIVSHLESCEKLASTLAMGVVDAVIGWDVFEKWHPDQIESVKLAPSEMPRVGYIPVAITKFSTHKGLSEKFVNFVTSRESREIFKQHGYLVDPEELKKIAPASVVGGENLLLKKQDKK